MSAFCVTFGQQYRHELHPLWGAAHPDGYVVIEAADEEAARAFAFANFGQAWAFIHPAESFDVSFYPRGVLATFHAAARKTATS